MGGAHVAMELVDTRLADNLLNAMAAWCWEMRFQAGEVVVGRAEARVG